MKIGDWEAKSCLTGMFRLDGGAMFGVVPKVLWSREIPADDENRIPMAMRTLVAVGREKAIIVDSGAGTGYGEKEERIYSLENRGLVEALRGLGLRPSDITDVIVTHLHFDHAGGLVFPFQGKLRLAFPEAVHHIQKAQWDHALNPNPRDRASYFKARIEVLMQERVVKLHDGDWSLGQGLEVLTFRGHTPGQHLLKLTGGGRTLFYCGDLIPTAAHIPLPYIMSYDLDPVIAMEEKSSILERAHDERWILFFEHDPEIEACYVEKEDGRFIAGEHLSI